MVNKKWYPYLLVLLLGIAALVIKLVKGTGEDRASSKPDSSRTINTAIVNRDRGFDRRVSFLKYSNHAKCRMGCRKITQEEVEEIMRDGKINYNKSDIKNARCPRYAVEGRTKDDQRVRIVYAQCNESTTVVTVIDLETYYACDCPGDDDKYENKNR